MEPYKNVEVEKKWQKIWAERHVFDFDVTNAKDPFYLLVMFPYPSGAKLHIGHWFQYSIPDSYGRFLKMNGKNVLHPMGFDAFGLPAENYAIKTGTPPAISTDENVRTMIEQYKKMGVMYDWKYSLNSSRPDYYRWTQWIFLQLYKKGLAYRKNAPVNWCPSCQTVLANEQVKEGACDRCDTIIVQKDLTQWFFKIRDYAETLLDNEKLDWPEKTRKMQQYWIGRSEGITYRQKIKDLNIEFEAYDSVPQTFMAQTYVVIAPEHPLVAKLVAGTEHEKPVMEFVQKIKQKKVANKFKLEGEMEGIFTGRYVENPFGTGDLPLWIASFVVYEYGTGIVNSSAHDERDFAFAKKYDIPLHPVMFPADSAEAEKVRKLEYCYARAEDGVMAEPAEFKGRKWGEARHDILDFLVKKGFGVKTVNFKLRDWLISRQRYWGAPIPIIHCEKCGEVAVPEKDLPVLLPEKGVDYLPKGKSPLASVPEFVNTKCPTCGGKATREVDTMDTFVDSSWYFLRYLSPQNTQAAFDPELVKKWLPVDLYIGGPEHACMHLLYARFIHKVLMDDRKAEPFQKLVHQGLITKDGAKMSKSKGNVVSPDEFVHRYGSDVFRLYMMFMGPFVDGGDWNDRGITGMARFLDRLWRVVAAPHAEKDSRDTERVLHQTIQKVSRDIELFHFNTAISAIMQVVNDGMKNGLTVESKKMLVLLAAPLAPHCAEEAWELLGQKFSVFDAKWPAFDPKLAASGRMDLVIQVNGKVRATVSCDAGISQAEAIELARQEPNVAKYFVGANIEKEIFVPGKLVNFVVK